MELLIREALRGECLESIDFEKLRQYYIMNGKTQLEKPVAKSLLVFLLSKTGLKEIKGTKKRLTLNAKSGNNFLGFLKHFLNIFFFTSLIAFNVFAFFLSEDKEFQNTFEELSVTQLRKKLKFARHINEGPEEHKIVAVKVIYFITTHFRKFENWRLYVKESAHQEVLSRLATIFAFDEDK